MAKYAGRKLQKESRKKGLKEILNLLESKIKITVNKHGY